MPAHPAGARWPPHEPPALDREPRLHAFALPRERAAAKLRDGRPLLHDEPVALDLDFATELFLVLLRELEPQPRARAVAEAVAGGQLDAPRLFTESFVRHADHVRQIATLPGLDDELISDLARRAVRPLLRAYAEQLAPFVERLNCWDRGYCPICGGQPLPGEERMFSCAACSCTWQADPEAVARAGTGFRLELALPEDESW